MTMQTERRGFYKSLLVITLPLLLQNLMNAAVSATDTVMLGYVGQNQLAASSLAGNLNFLFNMFLSGVGSGSSVLIAQYWGRQDHRTIGQTVGIALRFTLAVGFLFSCAAICFPEAVMRIYTTDTALIDYGTQYLRIVGAGYLLNAFTQVYIAAQRAMERTMFGTAVNLTAMILNVALNACFIFGIGPFPALGIVGVAIATLISQTVSCAIALADAARSKHPARIRPRMLFAKNPTLLRDFMHYTLPALGNDFSWAIGFSVYTVILGRLGADVVAANSYANTVRNISTVACCAVASAAAIMLGKTLGENKLEEAQRQGRRFLMMSVVTGLMAGALVLVTRTFVLDSVSLTSEATDYLSFMLYVSAANVVGMSINTMCICGIFRSGGDTRFGFIFDTCVMWLYGVALGSLGAFVLHLPPMAVYFILFMDEAVKIIPNFIRYAQKKWVRNITRDMAG